MKNESNSLERSLIVKEKENIFSKFFNWMKGLFKKNETKDNLIVEKISTNTNDSFLSIHVPESDITIPKSVKMTSKIDTIEDVDKNSLEYLYKLSDNELDNLNKLYDVQMEEAKNEIEKLNGILESYKESIKKMQEQIEG